MNILKISALALATTAAAGAASAGDWTGGYGGIELGYGDVTANPGASGDGALYGLTAGYDYDFGSWVVGAGIDYDWADITVGGTDIDSIARLKLRAGYDTGPGLVYGLVGGARAYTAAGDDSGWLVGVGYEHMITNNVSLGGELNYHQFDNFAGTGSDIEATTLQLRTTFRF